MFPGTLSDDAHNGCLPPDNIAASLCFHTPPFSLQKEKQTTLPKWLKKPKKKQRMFFRLARREDNTDV